jgi:parallel beta-helix repeat protein
MEFVGITNANPYEPLEEAPLGYRIYSDGTTDTPNLRRDGNTYTFTGNIEGTIVIECDGIVLDGTGYTLQGNGDSAGVWLQDRSGVTIKNLNIQKFCYGIRFSHYFSDCYSGQTNPNRTTLCTIETCNITENNYGISFYQSKNCSVLGNYIANNTYGAYLYGSDNVFRSNRFEQNTYNFWDIDEFINDVDSSNTINGKPVYYWVNQHNRIVPSDAGIVILKNCSGIRVQNLDLSGNGNGISLYYTNNSELLGNTLSDNYWRGIAVWWSQNNSIIGNQIANTTYDGIELYDSDNNIISHNRILANEIGIYHRTESTNEVISNNQIIGNRHAGMTGPFDNSIITNNFIYENGGGITVGTQCVVKENNITQNQGTGIVFWSNNLITENYISKNPIGVLTNNGQGNTITANSIVENEGWGIRFQGPATNNLVYANNFIRNNGSEVQASIKGSWIFPDLSKIHDKDANPSPPQHIAGPPNFWDNGTVGNYWSNYNFDAQNTENSTVGTVPYFIDNNNQDNHPLLAPLEFATIELPSTQPPQEPSITQTTTPGTESFPTTTVMAVAIAITGISLLVCFKKKFVDEQKHKITGR